MAAAALPQTAPPEAAGRANEEGEEEQCRICRLPAEADQPLCRPCACSGSMQFVHEECQFQWMAISRQRQCEVCNRIILTRPLYAADAPARLPVSEILSAAPGRIIGLMLPLLFAACAVHASVIRLATFWTWRIAFARNISQAHHLLSLCLSATSVIASIARGVFFAQKVMPFVVAPFTLWVERLDDRLYDFRGFDGLQVVGVLVVELSYWVLIVDMALASIFGFLPFSLGRIILWCMSSFNFVNVDELDSYTSTASVPQIGYGFIFSVGGTCAGLNTFLQYLTGERLMIAIFLKSRRDIFFRGTVYMIPLANIFLNILNLIILQPLFFGWLLDICTSKMFGATISERLRLLIASSLASNALHWLVGEAILRLRPKLSKLVRQILRPGATISFAQPNLREPFYKFYFKKFPLVFASIVFIILVILVPIETVVRLAPEVFPLDITYFDCPGKDTPFWQGLGYFAESVSGICHLKFLIGNMVLYLEWLVERVTLFWFVTAGEALGNSISPKYQYGSSDEVKDKRRFVVGTIPRVLLSWSSAVIFNSAMIFFSISVGRRFLFVIPQLGRLKTNDLFAISVGLCIISTIITTARDSFACMTSGVKRLLALEMHLLFFIWILIIPLLIGLLVDLSLLSPFIGPDDNAPALGFFCTWFLGRQLQNVANKLAPRTRFSPYLPFMAYFVDESWDRNLCLAREALASVKLIRLLQDELLPVATKLLAALGVPYVLAKGIFPRLGYSAAMNSAVYRFAWFGSLAFCVVCCLLKVFWIKLHRSIRDDRYAIGRKLEDVAASHWTILLRGLCFE